MSGQRRVASAVGVPTAWGACAVALVVATTSVSGHWAVTGRPPPPLAVVGAALLTAALVARRGAEARGTTAVVLVGQVVFHLVFTLASGAGCLPVLGRAASAGVDLALLRTGVDCVTAGPVDALGVALLAGLTALPLVVGHLLAGVLGVRGAGWVAGLVLGAVALRGAVGSLLTARPVAQVVAARAVQASREVPLVPVPVARRPLTRRGPPAARS